MARRNSRSSFSNPPVGSPGRSRFCACELDSAVRLASTSERFERACFQLGEVGALLSFQLRSLASSPGAARRASRWPGHRSRYRGSARHATPEVAVIDEHASGPLRVFWFSSSFRALRARNQVGGTQLPGQGAPVLVQIALPRPFLGGDCGAPEARSGTPAAHSVQALAGLSDRDSADRSSRESLSRSTCSSLTWRVTLRFRT